MAVRHIPTGLLAVASQSQFSDADAVLFSCGTDFFSGLLLLLDTGSSHSGSWSASEKRYFWSQVSYRVHMLVRFTKSLVGNCSIIFIFFPFMI